MEVEMTEPHITNPRDRKTAKYRRLHLMLALECSLAKSKDPKRDRKIAASQGFKQRGE